MIINISNKQKGFALFDVFLAVIILTVITVASYQFLGSSSDSKHIQSLETNIMTLSQSYAPFLYPDNLSDDTSNDPIIDNNSGKVSIAFLNSIPIANQLFVSPNDSYTTLFTNLTVGGKRSVMGFFVTNKVTDPSDHYFDTDTRYLVAAFRANQAQTSKLIQDLNNSFGVFYGCNDKSLKDIKNSATHLPDQEQVASCDYYSVYIVSPKTDQSDNFKDDFIAPKVS